MCDEILAHIDECLVLSEDEEGFLELDFLVDSVQAHAIHLLIILSTDYQVEGEAQPEWKFQAQREQHVNNDFGLDDDLVLSKKHKYTASSSDPTQG